MRCFDEVCKGLDNSIALWNQMVDDDIPYLYRRKIKPI